MTVRLALHRKSDVKGYVVMQKGWRCGLEVGASVLDVKLTMSEIFDKLLMSYLVCTACFDNFGERRSFPMAYGVYVSRLKGETRRERNKMGIDALCA